MAELHSNLYVKHKNENTNELLRTLLESFSKGSEAVFSAAESVSPGSGKMRAKELLEKVEQDFHDCISPESIESEFGYTVAHLVNGGTGDYIVGQLVKFINELCPDVHCQAWGCGDDDPWEYWFKYENGRVIRCDDEPYMDEDAWIKSTIYRWWHEQMPAEIKEGFLNEDEFDPDDDESEPATEDQYQEWVSRLTASSDQNQELDDKEQGIEPPISGNDVKELMGAIGDMFSLFKGAAKGSKNPQDNAFKADKLSEDLVRAAFDDISKNEEEFNLDGVLKHYSKGMKCISNTHDEGLGGDVSIPMSYALFKMGLAMILKPEACYLSNSNIDSIDINDNETATLKAETESQFIDPETKKLMKVKTNDVMTWGIEDEKLQVIAMESTEMEKIFIER